MAYTCLMNYECIVGCSNRRECNRRLIAIERDACAAKAREFASHYPQESDGRNTFVLLAEWIENRASAPEVG